MATSEKKTRLGIFNTFVLLMNVIAALALAVSYLSVHISPEKAWVLPLFGLSFPYLLLVNFLFVIYWLILRKWLFILSLAMILIGWNHTGRIIRISGHEELPQGIKAIKLTSYNVKNLSNDNVNLSNQAVRNKIVSFLDQNSPDILCLQEFAVFKADPDAFIDSLSERLGLPYHAYSPYSKKQTRGLDALFIFSKFPIIASEGISKDESHNFGIFSDIIMNQDTFRLFNVHLQSFHFRHEDYSFISNLDLQFDENENIKEGSIRIFKKLRLAYEKRAKQAERLLGMIEQSPYPVVLCGDFNDTPNSYAYQQLASRLSDAFVESGRGFGNTYSGKLPSFRIDFILYDDFFDSWQFTREVIELSDHYPISCYLAGKRP